MYFGVCRVIKSYVLRAGRMTEKQKQNYVSLSNKWCIPMHFHENEQNSHVALHYEEIFGNANPVVIEIGFGMGKATSLIAQEHPHINYIGIEVHKAGVGKLLGEIEAHKLQNVRIIEYDAVQVLEQVVCNNSIYAFHIFFPDPWTKKRHHKRRLIQRPLTNLLAQKLCVNGYIYMATDWQNYGECALEELCATENLKNVYEGFAPHQTWRPETRFEEKGKAAQHAIYELFFVRT